MRKAMDIEALEAFMRTIGARATSNGVIYITGGGSAVLQGWRLATIDIDIRMDPEPEGAFEAIPAIKRELRVNVELASPQDFLPPLPGWRERSTHIAREGRVDFYHYDFVSQALSKIERGHHKDLKDVQAMIDDALVTEQDLREGYAAILDQMVRYPSIDADVLLDKIDEFFSRGDDG